LTTLAGPSETGERPPRPEHPPPSQHEGGWHRCAAHPGPSGGADLRAAALVAVLTGTYPIPASTRTVWRSCQTQPRKRNQHATDVGPPQLTRGASEAGLTPQRVPGLRSSPDPSRARRGVGAAAASGFTNQRTSRQSPTPRTDFRSKLTAAMFVVSARWPVLVLSSHDLRSAAAHNRCRLRTNPATPGPSRRAVGSAQLAGCGARTALCRMALSPRYGARGASADPARSRPHDAM
jgi:hypothetical protein